MTAHIYFFPLRLVARKEVGNQAYTQFCSVVGIPTIPPAPIRLQYLKGIDHTHSTQEPGTTPGVSAEQQTTEPCLRMRTETIIVWKKVKLLSFT